MGLSCKKNIGAHRSIFDKLDRGYKYVKKAARMAKKEENKNKKN